MPDPDDAKLQAYYNDNKASFMTPEFRKFNVLVATAGDLKKDVQVTDEELKASYESDKDTYDTLHMWTQIVGKIALASAPPLNHCWAVALHVTSRGLSTRLLRHADRSFTMEFDLVGHRLVIAASDGARRALPLAPRSVADFYGEVMSALREMRLPVSIWPMPVEVPSPIRFDSTTSSASRILGSERGPNRDRITRAWRTS